VSVRQIAWPGYVRGSAMPSRRRSRFEKLFAGDAERFIMDALKLRRTILQMPARLAGATRLR
jgi:hypothetical protein